MTVGPIEAAVDESLTDIAAAHTEVGTVTRVTDIAGVDIAADHVKDDSLFKHFKPSEVM